MPVMAAAFSVFVAGLPAIDLSGRGAYRAAHVSVAVALVRFKSNPWPRAVLSFIL